jgi:hypothetical protein
MLGIQVEESLLLGQESAKPAKHEHSPEGQILSSICHKPFRTPTDAAQYLLGGHPPVYATEKAL